MEKRVWAVCALVVAMATVAEAQVFYGNNDNRRHHFGVGIATPIMDGDRHVNPFMKCPVYREDRAYNDLRVTVSATSGYSLFLDYQFDFNDQWSVEIKPRYTYRDVYLMIHTSLGGNMAAPLDFGELSLPLTVNYRIACGNENGVELFCGAALHTLGLRGMRECNITSMVYETMSKIVLHSDATLSLCGVAGLQLRIPMGQFILKPFFSYTVSPSTHLCYEIYRDYREAPYSDTPSLLRINELEVGLALQF